MANGNGSTATLKSSHRIEWGQRSRMSQPVPVQETSPILVEPKHDSGEFVVRQAKLRNPTVSVVIPAYNVEKYIAETLDSVLSQKFHDFEVILVDDGSTDRTLAIATERFDKRVTIITKSNGGTGSALNVGFLHSRGKYLTWWSADSVMLPDFLSTLKRTLEKNKSVGFVYSDWGIVTPGDFHIHKRSPSPKSLNLRKRCDIGPCWMWRREVLEKCGPYSTELCEDYDMHLRMARVTKFAHIPKVLGYWRDRPDNLTTTTSIPHRWVHSYRVQSRDKWRDASALKVLHLAPEIDSAGVGWWHCRAFVESNRNVAVRQVVGTQSYLNQLADLKLPTNVSEVNQLLSECDLIHLNGRIPCETWWTETGLAPLPNKPIILHFHGGHYFWDAALVSDWVKKHHTTVVSCSPHIAEIIPGARWMPNLIPIDSGITNSELFSPSDNWPTLGDPPTVAMHHNYGTGKGADAVLWLVERLQNDFGLQINLSVQQKNHLPLHEHIESKKRFDIVIDQLTQGFVGMAAWESLAQGAVVFARMDDFALREYTRLGNGTLPPIQQCRWIDELAVKLMHLLKNPSQIIKLKRAGRAWMLRHYTATKLLKKWEGLYREVVR